MGVGFVEELIFRGWLLTELINYLGFNKGILSQALIFSLVHIRLDIPLINLITLILGLFLFG